MAITAKELAKRIEAQEQLKRVKRTQDQFPPMQSLENWQLVAVEAQRILKNNVKENGPALYGDLLDKLKR